MGCANGSKCEECKGLGYVVQRDETGLHRFVCSLGASVADRMLGKGRWGRSKARKNMPNSPAWTKAL